jgi:hypothetical protein
MIIVRDIHADGQHNRRKKGTHNFQELAENGTESACQKQQFL